MAEAVELGEAVGVVIGAGGAVGVGAEDAEALAAVVDGGGRFVRGVDVVALRVMVGGIVEEDELGDDVVRRRAAELVVSEPHGTMVWSDAAI